MSIAGSPLLLPEGSRGRRLYRIVRGIVVEVVLFLVLTILAPVLLGVAAVIDLVLWLRSRKPWMGVRIVILIWWFLFGELRGLLGVLGVWLLAGGPWAHDTPARRRRIYRLQVAWAAGHLAGVSRICGVGFDVEGEELVGEGPLIVMARHASVVDNALPARLISRPHGLDLRYVLKSDLENLPTLDVGARWVPTCFVRRRGDDPGREIDRVRTLAMGLDGKRDGVLIFPEGTRFTRRKLDALKAEATKPERVARLARLRHLLPPRPGGPVVLLEEAPQAAVVIVGHVGLDEMHGLGAIWRGGLVGTRVRVRIWRHERAELPTGHDELTAWLFDRWQALDDWVDGELARRAVVAGEGQPVAA